VSVRLPLIKFSSYKTLNSRTRLFLGLGLMVNAALALQFSDQIESALGLTPTPEDQNRLPRISVVERSTK